MVSLSKFMIDNLINYSLFAKCTLLCYKLKFSVKIINKLCYDIIYFTVQENNYLIFFLQYL